MISKKKIIFCLIIFIFNFNLAISSDFKIIVKINNEILTNYDVEIEEKYLMILNPNLGNLDKKKLKNCQKIH